MEKSWQSIAARKQAERASRIPLEWRVKAAVAGDNEDILALPRKCGILTDRELSITESYDATDLRDELAKGSLKAEDVARAFAKRAAVCQQAVNCLTEILFEDALVRARELDAHFQKTGKPIGPLHGLPISLKDTFKIKGYDASIGIADLCFQPAHTNSALVDLLISQGAVLYCKTNVPQTMMALDSHNNVFGRTINPGNTKLTAGGSSGGECALIAMRGSILGIGTDVGGSIRVPAACNGLYGVKPSHGRVPFAGQEGGVKAGSSKLGIEPTAGPIATSARDCALLLQVISDGVAAERAFDDPDVIGQRWAQQLPLPNTSSKPLRAGIIRTDGHVQPLPPIIRLMDDVAHTLRSSSSSRRTSASTIPPVQVVDVTPLASPILARALKVFNGLTTLDGANDWFDLLDKTHEPLSPWLQGRLRRRAPKPLAQARALHAQRLELQSAFLQIWNAEHLDVLLLPVAPHPIAPIDRWNSANYTAALNLLDLPAGVLPVRACTRLDLRDELLPPDDSSTPPLNGWDKINRELWTTVDRSVYLDSPLSVQVITPRLTERKLVEAMGILDEALRPLKKKKKEENNDSTARTPKL
ncbi:fatty-acid amide hydrolase like [Lecanosticta acicola]|uniref:Fatty-acid amide hydrolase like n=1 Tax=Lecanosticta acicola TaxID=111012 RepID=A0AAI8Z0J5_9PEZI|nr:fatty-acid amide hydrolase like [Lecanosticta acicola]